MDDIADNTANTLYAVMANGLFLPSVFAASSDWYSSWIDDSDQTVSKWLMNVYVETLNCDTGTTLVTNGGFDSATTGWTAVASATLASIAGGQSGNCLQVTNGAAAAGYGYQSLTTVVGQRYRVNVYFKAGTAGAGGIKVGTSAADGTYVNITPTDTSWTLYTRYFTATTTITVVTLYSGDSTSGNTGLYDTVSVVAVGSVTMAYATNGGSSFTNIGETGGTSIVADGISALPATGYIGGSTLVSAQSVQLKATIHTRTSTVSPIIKGIDLIFQPRTPDRRQWDLGLLCTEDWELGTYASQYTPKQYRDFLWKAAQQDTPVTYTDEYGDAYTVSMVLRETAPYVEEGTVKGTEISVHLEEA
jgi:hypothetical protein